MKKLTFYLIVLIIVLAGLSYTFYHLNKKHKVAAVRWEQNFSQQDKNFRQLEMTVKEFQRNIDFKTDSILKIAQIKPKLVTQVTNYITNYTDTTISVIRPEYDMKTASFPFVDNTGCFEYVGFIEVDSIGPELNVTERKFFSDFTDIEYIRKDTIHFLGLNFVKWWQAPEVTFTIIDNCTGQKRVKKINIK